MATFLPPELKAQFTTQGWTILAGIIPRPKKIAASIITEVEACIFQTEEEIKAIKQLRQDGIDPLTLLTNTKLRAEYLTNPKSVWFNDNSRTPKLAKNNGLVNIMHNNLVRDKVLFNKDVYTAISELYATLTGDDEDVAYIYGSDRVCVKPQHSTDMDRHIDCDILALSSQNSRQEEKMGHCCAATHPLTEFRIQSVACLQIDSTAAHNGRTEVLSGYSSYFRLGARFFRDYFDYTPEKEGRKFRPIVVQKVFADHLDEFRTYVDKFYKAGQLRPLDKTPFWREGKATSRNKEIFATLPKRQVPIEWIQPIVKAGDIFCFDQRLPHRNTKNTSEIARVACFVSLYPGHQLATTDPTPFALFRGKGDAARMSYSNTLERAYFAEVWEERTTFKMTRLRRRMLKRKKILKIKNPT